MPFNPSALSERTLKQFVDRLLDLRKKQGKADQWPPKRHLIQEEIAAILGFPNWHAAVGAIKTAATGSGTSTALLSAAAPSTGVLPHWPHEPARFTYGHFKRLLAWAHSEGASDITFSTGEQVFIERYGTLSRGTKRVLGNEEMLDIIAGLAEGSVDPYKPLDMALSIEDETSVENFRFRVNATSLYVDGRQGWQVTLRTVASMPPDLEAIEASTLGEHLKGVHRGMVIVSGGTGSGKTTTISSLVKTLAKQRQGKIITYDAPIEYEYNFPGCKSSISQHEVGRHVASFPEAVRNAMRRKPSVIVVGECRDVDTLVESTQAANLGYLMVMGVQGSDVVDTITRLLRVMGNDKPQEAMELLHSLSLVSSQMLVKTTRGTRVVLRETLALDHDMTDRLVDIPPEQRRVEILRMLDAQGEGFVVDARKKFKLGIIDAKQLKYIEMMDKFRRARK